MVAVVVPVEIALGNESSMTQDVVILNQAVKAAVREV